MKYDIHDYDKNNKMLIGGFCAPSVRLSGDDRQPAQAAFDDSKELGLDFLVPDHFQCDFGDAPEDAFVYLDRAHKSGLKVYVYDTGLGCRTSAGHTVRDDAWEIKWAKNYIEHPAFMGLHFFDEPFGDEVHIVAQKQIKWREQFPGKVFMVNLNPGYAPNDLLGYKDKEKKIKADFRFYIENYIKLANPDILSFDHYAIMEKGNLRETFFAETALIGYQAKKHKIQSHFYILTSGHGPYRRYPTEAELNWQIAIGMTFGLQSFTHYTAGAIYEGYDDIISPDFKRTQLWYNIQAVNIELNKWSHVYMGFSYEGYTIVDASHGRENVMLRLLDRRDGLIENDKIKGIKKISSSEDALLGSFIDKNDNIAFMLTNANNPNVNSVNPLDRKAAKVTIQFTDGYDGIQVFVKGVSEIHDFSENKTITISLESGEGKFIIPLKKKIDID